MKIQPSTSLAVRNLPRSGTTLIELTLVIVLVGILGSATFAVVLEAMGVYARTVPALEVSYQAELAAALLREDLRQLPNSGSILQLQPSQLSFVDSHGQRITYEHKGSELLRNGALLAQSVASLEFRYLQQDASAAVTSDQVHLIEAVLAIKSADQLVTFRTTVFPRRLST